MNKRLGIFLILILSIYFISFASAWAPFGFGKKPNENINVSVHFQTSSAIRTGTTFQASATIQNFNEYKPAIIKEIEILDENQNSIKIVKLNNELKSLKKLFEE